jgi:hypothetical protein
MLVMGLWLGMDRFGGMFCILAYGLYRAIGPLLVSHCSAPGGGLRKESYDKVMVWAREVRIQTVRMRGRRAGRRGKSSDTLKKDGV